MRPRSWTAALAAVVSLVIVSLAGCASTGSGGAFTLSTTAVSGPPGTGFDSGLVSVGRLDAMYGAKAGRVLPTCARSR